MFRFRLEAIIARRKLSQTLPPTSFFIPTCKSDSSIDYRIRVERKYLLHNHHIVLFGKCPVSVSSLIHYVMG